MDTEEITKKMKVKKEGTTNVGKADAGSIKKEDTNMGKADVGNAAILFDKPLFHVLTVILRLKLDNRHSHIRKYLCLRKCEYWEDLEIHILGNYIAVKDPNTGEVPKLPDRDCKLFSKLDLFIAAINNDDSLSRTLSM